ncbi:hypothetical protein GS3922_04165 [Geobacillus subterraneus]|uniref:Uncharacterized protein n=1 Tax=Geobacillus subterraneus TaxID=129338 RepID=A0ABN4NES0_9BACL|nr:hypothetical protein GS3922_04165 [Geobacillus subterraneus]
MRWSNGNATKGSCFRSSRLLFFSPKFVIVMNEAVGMASGSEPASLMICGKGLAFSEKYDMISV